MPVSRIPFSIPAKLPHISWAPRLFYCWLCLPALPSALGRPSWTGHSRPRRLRLPRFRHQASVRASPSFHVPFWHLGPRSAIGRMVSSTPRDSDRLASPSFDFVFFCNAVARSHAHDGIRFTLAVPRGRNVRFGRGIRRLERVARPKGVATCLPPSREIHHPVAHPRPARANRDIDEVDRTRQGR